MHGHGHGHGHGDLRLGFISGRMCSRGTGTDAGKLYCHPGLGRLVDALRSRVGKLTVAMSLAPERPTLHDHQVDMAEADFVALPHLPGTIAGLRQDLPCRRAFAEVERRCDAVIVQLPFSPPTALVPARRPRVYHVCADVPSVVRASAYYQGVRVAWPRWAWPTPSTCGRGCWCTGSAVAWSPTAAS